MGVWIILIIIMGIDSGLGDSSTTPKQGKKILIVIAIVLVALIGGGLIFG